MSRDASITLPFAGDETLFVMSWGEIIRLQEVRNCGPYVVLDRLVSGNWLVEDIREVIRIGLIGGGMDVAKAIKLVREHVEKRPPLESLVIAQRILGAGLVGAPDEPPGEDQAANQMGNASTTSPTEKSDLPPSTRAEP